MGGLKCRGETTINLIDALKSNKNYRIAGSQSLWTKGGPTSAYTFTVKEILSDYETQELSVTITASQFWEAYAEGTKEAHKHWRQLTSPPDPIGCYSTGHSPIDEMARKLGLEP